MGKKGFLSKFKNIAICIVALLLISVAIPDSNGSTKSDTSTAVEKSVESTEKTDTESTENTDGESTENTDGESTKKADGKSTEKTYEKSEEESTDTDSVDTSNNGNLEIHFIDVGQGNATLIISDGEAMLYDAGNNDMGTTLQLYLKKQGVTQLKYIVGSHPDADHIGGLDVIITKFDITSGKVFMPDVDNDTATYRDVISAIKYKSLKRKCPGVGDIFELGSATITVLGPNKTYSDSNDNSIVLMVKNGNNKFLLTGDASETAEADLVANGGLDADVLLVGHHGSKSSTSGSFLKAVSPTYAVISVGEDNSYGHPTADCLNKLRSSGVKLFRTDEQGSIIAYSDGKNITWNCSPTDTWQAGESTGSSKNSSGTSVTVPSQSETGNDLVWVPVNGGTKYHSKSTCSNMKNPKQVQKSTAEADGYTPCKKCY